MPLTPAFWLRIVGSAGLYAYRLRCIKQHHKAMALRNAQVLQQPYPVALLASLAGNRSCRSQLPALSCAILMC